MGRLKALIKIGLISALLLAGSLASARVNSKKMKHLVMPEAVSNDEVAEGSLSETISDKILPKNMTSVDNSQSVVSKIVDNSLMYWWDNSSLKRSAAGRAVTTIEKKMKAEVDLGSSDSEVDHKLSFRVLAAQALAKLEYTGWFKAALNYDARSSTAEAEVLENLQNNKDLVITHSVTRGENKSQLSLRWNW